MRAKGSRYAVKAYSVQGILGEEYEDLTGDELDAIVNELYRERQYGPLNIMISRNGREPISASELLGI